MAEPKPKQILLCVAGQTPQIITETLYVLMIKRRPAAPISAIYIVTTAKGAEIAWRALGGPDGQIARMCREFGLNPKSIEFTEELSCRVATP